MPLHTITNTGPSWIGVFCEDGSDVVVKPFEVFTGNIVRIEFPPKGRIEFRIEPGSGD